MRHRQTAAAAFGCSEVRHYEGTDTGITGTGTPENTKATVGTTKRAHSRILLDGIGAHR